MNALVFPVTISVFFLMSAFFFFLHWTSKRLRRNAQAKDRIPGEPIDWDGVRVKVDGPFLNGPHIGTLRGYGRVTQHNEPHEQWYPAWLVDVDGSSDRVWMKEPSLQRETFFHYNFRKHGFGRTSWGQFAFFHALLLLGIVLAGWPMVATTVVIDGVWIFWGNRRNFNNKQG